MALNVYLQLRKVCWHDADLRGEDVTRVNDILSGGCSFARCSVVIESEFDQLLSILAVGFAQGLYALDAADGQTDHSIGVRRFIIVEVS